MKLISLQPFRLGYAGMVDDDDYERVSALNWFCYRSAPRKHRRKVSIYVLRRTEKDGVRTVTYLHHFVTGKRVQTDHKDGNGLNNQKHNLRQANNFQNNANRKKFRGVSKYKGVHWHKRDKHWVASICQNYVQFELGIFEQDGELEAALLYDYAARKVFGEFASCNFPDIASRPALADQADERLQRRLGIELERTRGATTGRG